MEYPENNPKKKTIVVKIAGKTFECKPENAFVIKTDNKLQLQNITDLVSVLMLSEKKFDMSTIEHCVEIEMQETNLRWRPYFVVLAENIDGYKQSPHETVEEYFFDAINSGNITEGKIAFLVKLCIS